MEPGILHKLTPAHGKAESLSGVLSFPFFFFKWISVMQLFVFTLRAKWKYANWSAFPNSIEVS